METRGDRPRPPREAIDACADVEPGGTCSFEGRRGEDVVGTCESLGDVVACKPEGGPPGGERSRPPR